MSATEPQQAFLSDYLEGAKSIEEMTEADLDAASRGDRDVYYEARDGRRRRLTQGAAQRESKRRKKPTEGRPDPLTQEQRQEYEAELLTGEPSEEAMLALIMAAPEVAQEAAQNGLSRSLFNRLMGEMTGDPRDRGTNKAVRKKLQNLLSNNLDFIRTEVGSRSRTTVGLSVAPTFADTDAQQDRSPPPSQTIGTPDGNIEVEDDGASGFVGDGPQEISTPDGVQSVEFEESTEFIRRRREGRAGRSPVTTSRDPGGRFAPTTMSESETRAQDRRRSQEEVGPQTRSLTEADRTKVDSALDSVLEETGDDLLRDTSLSNRQVARRLPRSIPFGKRLQRVRELRMRRGITNAVTDSRASTTEQQSDLDQAQDARNKQEAQERGVLAGESPGDMATAAQGGLEVQSFMDEYFEGSARLLSDQRNQEIINEQSQSDDEMAASMHVDEDNSPELSEEQQQESEAIAEENNSNTEQLAERSSADMTTRSNAEENENVDDEDDLEDEGDILVEPLSKNNKLKGLGARLLAPLHFVAQKAGVNSRPYKVMQKLIHLEIQQLFANRRDMSEAKEAFNALPEDWKNKEDNKLSQAMDQYIPMQEGEQEVQFEAEVVDAQGQARTEPVTARTESEARAKLEEMGLSLRSEGMRQTTAQPELTLEPDAELTINGETMKVSDLPPEVQSSLAYFKRKSEEHRLEAIEDKRDLARSMFNGMTNKDLVKAAREGENAAIPGLEKSRVDGSDLFSADGRVYSKEEVVEKLVMNRVPDDWGYKYAHFHHAWFGKYKLRAYDKDGNALNVPGEANTEGEAYELLRQFKSSAAGAAAVRFEAKPAYDEDADFLNMTRRERNALKRALKSETNATSEQINDALFKGRVTLAENKSLSSRQ